MSTSDYELALRLQEEIDREYSNAESPRRRENSFQEVRFYGNIFLFFTFFSQ